MFDWQTPGYEPTPHELYLEELERPPSRSLLRAADDRALLDESSGTDRPSCPPQRTTPDGPASPSGAPTSTEKAT